MAIPDYETLMGPLLVCVHEGRPHLYSRVFVPHHTHRWKQPCGLHD